MKKYFKYFLLLLILLVSTGCSSKLYTYRDVVRKTNGKIAKDLVIEDPGYFNRNNGLRRYKGYLVRDKYKKITIINGQEYLLPIGQNYICTDFAEVYLVPEFDNLTIINRYKEYLNENNMFLNDTGMNRYEIYCQNGQRYN